MAGDLHAILNAFRFHENNSRVVTASLWLALALWGFGAVGLVTGWYRPDPAIWGTLSAVFGFLFGKAQERARRKAEE